MIIQNAQFLGYVLFNDESNFLSQRITNFHNDPGAEDRQHVIQEGRYQYEFSLNIGSKLLTKILLQLYQFYLKSASAHFDMTGRQHLDDM